MSIMFLWKNTEIIPNAKKKSAVFGGEFYSDTSTTDIHPRNENLAQRLNANLWKKVAVERQTPNHRGATYGGWYIPNVFASLKHTVFECQKPSKPIQKYQDFTSCEPQKS